jgi:hypothetical protein
MGVTETTDMILIQADHDEDGYEDAVSLCEDHSGHFVEIDIRNQQVLLTLSVYQARHIASSILARTHGVRHDRYFKQEEEITP